MNHRLDVWIHLVLLFIFTELYIWKSYCLKSEIAYFRLFESYISYASYMLKYLSFWSKKCWLNKLLQGVVSDIKMLKHKILKTYLISLTIQKTPPKIGCLISWLIKLRGHVIYDQTVDVMLFKSMTRNPYCCQEKKINDELTFKSLFFFSSFPHLLKH